MDKKRIIKSTNGWDFLISLTSTLFSTTIIVPIIFGISIYAVLSLVPENKRQECIVKGLDVFHDYHLLAWILLVIQTFGMYYLFRVNNKAHLLEVKRIEKEITNLQDKLLHKK